jgi:hypothetical protein
MRIRFRGANQIRRAKASVHQNGKMTIKRAADYAELLAGLALRKRTVKLRIANCQMR